MKECGTRLHFTSNPTYPNNFDSYSNDLTGVQHLSSTSPHYLRALGTELDRVLYSDSGGVSGQSCAL